MKRLSIALPDFLTRRLNAGLPFRLAKLWELWDALLDPEIAGLAKPLGHRKQTLVVGVEDPVAMQEASFYVSELLDMANGFLGQNYFDKVQFDLLVDKVPLNAARQPVQDVRRQPLQQPGTLGKHLNDFDADSVVARCYKAYVGLFKAAAVEPQPKKSKTRTRRRA